MSSFLIKGDIYLTGVEGVGVFGDAVFNCQQLNLLSSHLLE